MVFTSVASRELVRRQNVDMNIFLNTIRDCVKIRKITPTIVNTLIKPIEVYVICKDENSKMRVKVDIYFTTVGVINIPNEKEMHKIIEE